MVFLGVCQSQVIVAVMPGIQVQHFNAVEIFGGSRRAFFAEWMRLDQKSPVGAVFFGKGHKPFTDDMLGIGQELVVKSIEQIIVVRAVKAEFGTGINPDVIPFRLTFQTPVSEQKGFRLAAGSGEIDIGIIETFSVVMVSDTDGIVAGGGLGLHDGLCAQPAAVRDIRGVQMRFYAVHESS